MAHRLQIRPGGAVGNALPEALGKEEGLLQHNADVFPQVGEADVLDVHPANGDFAVFLGQLVEPVQQVHQGGFPRACGPQNAKGASGPDSKAHVVEHAALALVVAKAHLVKDDVPVHGGPQGVGLAALLGGV